MTRLEALVGLNLAGDIGSIRLKKLLDYFGKPENILQASPDKLQAVAGIGERISARIKSLCPKEIEHEFALAKKLKLRIMTLDDEDYPQNLRNIPDPPLVLYIKGQLKEQDEESIAIVGSRRASFYGLSCAGEFSAQLSRAGMTIVSGMARGIDAASHRGALKSEGRTLAVIGSGFNHMYPPENKELAEEISHTGAVISEFPIAAMPLAQHFPQRNRVISGLSLGVVVVEAARNSGALITADFALEQGREVFALPGRLDSGNAFGTLELIKQGAKLVTCVDDIIEELNIPQTFQSEGGQTGSKTESKTETETEAYEGSLTKEESRIWSLLSSEPMPLDDVAHQSQMNVPQLAAILLGLQLKKRIQELPGKQFIKN